MATNNKQVRAESCMAELKASKIGRRLCDIARLPNNKNISKELIKYHLRSDPTVSAG